MNPSTNILINTLIDNLPVKRKRQSKKYLLLLYKKSKNMKITLLNKLLKAERRKICKVQNYFNIVDRFQTDVFHQHFRMTRKTFELLVQVFDEEYLPGTKMVLRKALLVTIWKLCNQDTFRSLADRFNLSRGYAYKIVTETCKIICKKKASFIKWPTTDELIDVRNSFDRLRSANFPSVVGYVDGSHIPINATSQSTDYYNRKGFHSMILQGICDSRYVFLDAFFGWPGRSHDAHVWDNSPIGIALREKTLHLPLNCHLLGDSAYKLLPYLMVNYRDNGFLTEQQKKYNKVLNSTRVCIEQAFGMLKQKFRILKYVDTKRLSHIKRIVMACICLHNFIINKENIRDIPPEESEYLHDPNSHLNSEEQYGEIELNASEEAKLKRDSLCLCLSSLG